MTASPIFGPFAKRPRHQDVVEQNAWPILPVLQMNFSIVTWLLLGASLQALLVYVFSDGWYILLISTLLLLARIGRAVLQAKNILPNPYLKDSIQGRTTALMMNEKGQLAADSGRKIAVLHLGAKSNHPFGVFSPQFGGVGNWLQKMNKQLDAGAVKGFLGQTTFHRQDQRGAPEVVVLSYWESIEDLWAFGHDGLHREAWVWWEKTIKENGYVGINHEIFEADAKHWETIYINHQPTLMGTTTYLRKGNKIEGGVVADQWISPLVDARRGKLAKSSGRMDRELTTFDANRVAKEVYE